MSILAALWMAWWNDLHELVQSPVGLIILGSLVALLILLVAVRLLRGRKQKGGRESSAERLADLPPPPKAGATRLLLENTPVRLRLVVVAPVGKSPIDLDDVDGILDQVL